MTRDDLGPMLLGLLGAAVIIGGRWVFYRVMARPHLRRAKHVTFFAFVTIGFAALFVLGLGAEEAGPGFVLLGIAMIAIGLWATLGTAFEWPGFKPPPPPDDDDFYDV